MSVVTTEIIVTSTDASYSIPGDWTPTQIVTNYSSTIPGLSSMAYTQTVETRPEGQVRVITFSPKTGNKG